MTTLLRTVYEQYVDYVTQLRADFDRHIGPNVSEEFRAKLMTYEDFCLWWRRLADHEGLQETWQRRFELGYEAYSRGVRECLERRLASDGQSDSSSFVRDAA